MNVLGGLCLFLFLLFDFYSFIFHLIYYLTAMRKDFPSDYPSCSLNTMRFALPYQCNVILIDRLSESEVYHHLQHILSSGCSTSK